MDTEAEKVAEEIAPVIAGAIEGANERAEVSADIADAIADAAMEGERGRRIETLERDLGECLSNQAALSEALASLATQQSEMQGALSTLLALQPSPTLQTEESGAEDGPRESPAPEMTAAEAPAPEAPMAEAPAPERRKKKFRLI